MKSTISFKEQDHLEIVPDPVALIDSMRALGYSTESAIADIIDNSLSAKATQIDIKYDGSEEAYVAILDNGQGMNKSKLIEAMRHGGRNTDDPRDLDDLGRFSLGLKTASLSQCRKLTVVSRHQGETYALRWDLDYVKKSSKWLVLVISEPELIQLPLFDKLKSFENGTLVVWQDLDRLMGDTINARERMTCAMSPLEEHLALVFHRYIKPEDRASAVVIAINSQIVPSRDPFLRGNSYTQILEGQPIEHARGKISLQPYVLPTVSHLSVDEIDLAGGSEGLRSSQGFYIYRGKRLVIWGTWFGMAPVKEAYKLTRVQVDIPNTFDDLWHLDIRKSLAQPPEQIRTELRRLIPHFYGTSRKVIQYRGRVTRRHSYEPVWNRHSASHGKATYQINKAHPLFSAFAAYLSPELREQLNCLIDVVSNSLPVDSIYADMCEDSRPNKDSDFLVDLITQARRILELFPCELEQLLELDPFAQYPEHHKAIKEALVYE